MIITIANTTIMSHNYHFFWEEHLRSTLLATREGNGNPLQYSCLENPMEGGAW